MICYQFDGTKDGLLCCLFRSFTKKEEPIAVFSNCFQPSLDTTVILIETDEKIAERVRLGIKKSCGISLLSTIFYCFRSCDELKETVMFNALKKCLKARKNITDNFADPDALLLYDISKKISLETHRLKGILRFEEVGNGSWYAHVEPDNDVIDLIAPFFKDRFSGEKFIIHDVKRNLAVFCDGSNIFKTQLSNSVTVYLSSQELLFKELWKTYFTSVNIAQRKNKKLQDNYLPRLYRKHMSEFY